MNWFLRGALGLVLAATASLALAQTYGAPPPGYPAPYDPPLCCGNGPAQAYGPPPGYYQQAPEPDRYYAPPRGYAGPPPGYYDDRRAPDRYGPAPQPYAQQAYPQQAHGYGYGYDRGEFRVPSYGGAEQHYGDPRCATCYAGPGCGCGDGGYATSSYSSGAVVVDSGFFYDAGGVGPIPEGGSYGGGYVIMGGGGSSYASASSSAYASSSSRVSVRIGGRGGHGGHKGGGCGCHK